MYNELIRNEQVIRVNLDILEERARTMESLTRDRGIQIQLEGEVLTILVAADANVSQHITDNIQTRDHSITTFREFLLPHMNRIRSVYDTGPIPINVEHHRSILLGYLDRFNRLERILNILFGMDNN